MKIDIAIVGFQKAGTTSIQNYLGGHPLIYTHPQKEMTYFSIKNEFEEGEAIAAQRYLSELKMQKHVLIKHATLIRHEDSIKRLHSHNPECKIIVCLRDPVERAYSSYLMELANGNKLDDFETVVHEAFDNYKKGVSDWRYNIFIKLGEYVNYIELLLKYFTLKNIYFIKIEEFHKNPYLSTNKICKWLSIPPIKNEILKEKHNSYMVERSGFLSYILKWILSDNGTFKKLAKQIIPRNMHYLFGEKLRGINKMNAKKEPLRNDVRFFLENHFRKYNNKLTVLIGEFE